LPFTRKEVFAAFSDANYLAAWWGPDGFSNTFELFEFKAQGRWKFVMHGPDGTDYANECIFLETTLAKIIIRHVCEPLFTLTIALADSSDHTMLSWAQAFDDPAVAASIWHIIEPANEQNLNRLHAEISAHAVKPPTEQTDSLRLSGIDQSIFAAALIDPAKPNAVLKRAFANQRKLIAP
jgi:hypothetical protein